MPGAYLKCVAKNSYIAGPAFVLVADLALHVLDCVSVYRGNSKNLHKEVRDYRDEYRCTNDGPKSVDDTFEEDKFN